MFDFHSSEGQRLAQQEPSRPCAYPASIHVTDRVGALEKKLAEECANRARLELDHVQLRQSLDTSKSEKVLLLFLLKDMET